jgi:hypothetical protein
VVVGLVAYGQRADLLPSPEGDLVDAGVCGACSAAHIGAGQDKCEVCGRGEGFFTQMTIAQPLGFRSSYWPRDYNGRRGSRSFATRPRLAFATGLLWESEQNLRYSSGKASLVSVNDNKGRGFRFAEFLQSDVKYSHHAHGLISLDVLENRGLASRAGMSALRDVTPARTVEVSLGAVRRTDVLRMCVIDLPAHLDLDITHSLSARSAWLSLAFTLRNAAARLLDVGPDELITEISPRSLDDGQVVGELFLADRLENGAGYATWLGRNMVELLSSASAMTKAFSAHGEGGCDGSCYECLRDYSNAGYHPLLDWFLASEALSLVQGGDLHRDAQPWTAAVDAFASAFKWDVESSANSSHVLTSSTLSGTRTLLVTHPLLRTGSDPAPELLDLVACLGGADVQVTSGYEMARRPGLVESRARAGRLPRLGVKRELIASGG